MKQFPHREGFRMHRMFLLAAATLIGGATLALAAPARAQRIDLGDLGREALKGVAIGYAVKQSARPLNDFINTVTLRRGLRDRQTTRVVPMLSVGDKGYIGAAQVSGPSAFVAKTQAVWQYEGTKKWGDGIYRIKALVPSDSLNPLQIRRVQKVGVSAVIDVATGGPLSREGPYARGLGTGDVVKAGAVAVAVHAASRPLNDFVNTVTFNRGAVATRVVPMATFGEKAYIGGGQVSGSTTTIGAVKALWQYEDLFDRGRFRVKVLVPTDGINPLKLRRVPGVGLTALIDTSIQRQTDRLAGDRDRRGDGSRGTPLPVDLGGRGGDADDREDRRGLPPGLARTGGIPPGLAKKPYGLPPGQAKKRGLTEHDNGKHKGKNKKRDGEPARPAAGPD